MRRTSVLLAAALLASYAVPIDISATTIWVPDDYARIQSALDVATYGDTVMVRPGTYSLSTNRESFPLLMKSGVKLLSAGGATLTILDAQERGAPVVYFSQCDQTTHLRGFTIRGGATQPTASWSTGAGIYCRDSSPLIADNIIRDNTVRYWNHLVDFACGGGFYGYRASPTITGNTFAFNAVYAGQGHKNQAYAYGGAIYLLDCPTACIARNAFVGNLAQASAIVRKGAYGGAIYLSSPDARLSNNTFTRNQALGIQGGRSYGGALACYWSTGTTVTNSIFWDDEARFSPEICSIGSIEVTHSDVEGGYAGTGNIDTAPYFINAERGVLDLQHSSPCIDAGDPASPLDPDNTPADLGACYFDQSVTPSVELYPHGEPIEVPAPGGPVEYDGWVYNLADTAISVDIWTYAILPNHTRYGPVRQFSNVAIRPHARMGVNNLQENVPGLAPTGTYRYVGYVGKFPSTVLDSSEFTFTKSR